MYLKYLKIKNFKNLESATFEFQKGSNVILGENDSGKSNAMQALRILLDDSYYFSTKNLRESDFSNSLGNWKGHWIIISAFFDEISETDENCEIVRDLKIDDDKEKQALLSSHIRSEHNNYGTLTLYIRPRKEIRKSMNNAKSASEFEKIRETITLDDYEFVYRARSLDFFLGETFYQKIVGDIENNHYSNPEEDNGAILGSKVDMTEVWQYISVVFIDALRDVSQELRKTNNPIKKVMNNIREKINDLDIKEIKSIIRNLNETISAVDQIKKVSININETLLDTAGFIYSPKIDLASSLKDNFDSISRFITVKSEKDNLDTLGLGHLNVIYIALKLVEFKYIRNRELLNIMIIEEPEAHVHVHIQKTLFENMKNKDSYTQVIMTTHSTNISEVSEVDRMNILRAENDKSEVMNPNNKLEEYGHNLFNGVKNVNFVESVQRYLDAKRTSLLFAKGIILVEGDGEEILIPNLVKSALGVSLDELGISIINVGSVSFEYIASLFNEDRIRRNCAIITDLDRQIKGTNTYRPEAEEKGEQRKSKFDSLFADNKFVECFYADYTLEIDFAKEPINQKYIDKIISDIYYDPNAQKRHSNNISSGGKQQYDSIMTILAKVKKGWYSILLSNKLDSGVQIPDYILEAIIFASTDSIRGNLNLQVKLIRYALQSDNIINGHDEFIKKIKDVKTSSDMDDFIGNFILKNPNLTVTKILLHYY